MWSGVNYNKTNIEEANKHLQALMDRVNELQNTVQEQADTLLAKDKQMQTVVQDLAQKSQSEITTLRERLNKADSRNRRLEEMVEEKDAELTALKQKCKMLDELVKYKPVLAKLTISLEQAENFSNYAVNRKSYGGHSVVNGVQPKEPGLTLAERAGRTLHYNASDNPTDSELYM